MKNDCFFPKMEKISKKSSVVLHFCKPLMSDFMEGSWLLISASSICCNRFHLKYRKKSDLTQLDKISYLNSAFK